MPDSDVDDIRQRIADMQARLHLLEGKEHKRQRSDLNKAIYKVLFLATPHYEGAELCDAAADPLACPLGFTCPGQSSLQGCYGVTGPQILTSLKHVYEAADPDADVASNVGMVLLLTAVFKLGYHLNLLVFCRT